MAFSWSSEFLPACYLIKICCAKLCMLAWRRYWFSISDEEQQFRFQLRIHDPLKRWKLSKMDLECATSKIIAQLSLLQAIRVVSFSQLVAP